jgi:hypothetical protein
MLPGMPPRRWQSGDFGDWLRSYLDLQFPTWRSDRQDKQTLLDDVRANVPHIVVPRGDELQDGWVTKRVNQVLNAEGVVYPGGMAGNEVVSQDVLPLDEFRQYIIGKLRAARADVDAAIEDVQAYAEAHRDRIPDPKRFMRDCRKAAGL